jgi:hypothetical protein
MRTSALNSLRRMTRLGGWKVERKGRGGGQREDMGGARGGMVARSLGSG